MTVVTPLRAVLEAVEHGANTRQSIVHRTRLDPDVVDAATAHLVRIGRIASPSLRSACPTDGCGGCGSACSTDGLVQLGMLR